MKGLSLWARCLPIALLAMFGGTALIVCNPGYFWDDWVWIFHDSAENIQIGKELGVWWGGYLTTAINSLASPSIAMRITALVAWIVSGGAIALLLHRRGRVSASEAFQFFLLYCATHVAMIRFLTSVALYNVYIAAFWIGAAVLLTGRRSWKARWLSLVFLFFSFYLNSLILLYALVVALLALDQLRRHVRLTSDTMNMGGWRKLSKLQLVAADAIAQSRQPLRKFARDNVSLLALPFLFVIVKKLTTAKSQLYGTYNAIEGKLVLSSIGQSFGIIRPVLRDFFAISSRAVPPVALLASALVCFALLRLLPRATQRTSLRTAFEQLVLGLVFFAAAVYPYIIVDKPPQLTDFYDARNILPAVAGLDLILLALINIIDRGFARIPLLDRFGRDLLLAYVLGASISSGVLTGINLWHDWFRQMATMTYLRQHGDEVRDDRTFVFDDKSTQSRIGDRMIWNYEYTGNLIRTFGGRDHFGISINEYRTWPANVPLLNNAVMRRRFNIRDYDFRKPHVIVTIEDGLIPLKTPQVLGLAYSYLRGEDCQEQLGEYFSLSMAQEFTEADQRAAEMFQIAAALAAYHRDHGHYPTATALTPGSLPVHSILANGDIAPPRVLGDVPDLFPAYMPRPDTMRIRHRAPNYLYFSDGVDFKLVYSGASDLPYATQAHPGLIDSRNNGYGVWTSGARNW